MCCDLEVYGNVDCCSDEDEQATLPSILEAVRVLHYDKVTENTIDGIKSGMRNELDLIMDRPEDYGGTLRS